MKKTIIKIVLSAVSFIAALLIFESMMNRGNVNTTKNMDKATLPVVYMNIDGEDVNELKGYTGEVNLGLLRENITPLDDSRGVTFRVEKYGKSISGITASVRTVEGDRLIEKVEVTDYTENDYSCVAYVTFKDLMEEYTEYSLVITLSFSEGGEADYVTRIIEASSYCTKEKLKFAENFAELEISTDTNGALSEYMESNYLGDNTTLQKVDIHSSMEQLAFGNLEFVERTDPVISIKEIASETAVFKIEYIVTLKTGGTEKQYFVSEAMRMKYSSEVTYLLEFERSMEEVKFENSELVRTEDILLGIADEEINLIESDDGTEIAFVSGGTLYSFNTGNNRIARLFSFYDEENFDARTYRQDYSIKPLSIDEAGNVWFCVSGYMNRGTYEGRNGICLYYFNGITSEIEERFFIDSEDPAEVLNKELSTLCYLNRDGVFYIKLDSAIYAIDVENETSEVLVDSLEDDKFSVSEDSSMMVWQLGDDVNRSESLMLMNLGTKQITRLDAPEGEYIKPLAFFGDDFVYGLAKKEDVLTDGAGRTTFPMYIVKIQSKFGEILKTYSKENVYVSGVSIKDNLMTLERIEKAEGETLSYNPLDDEYITNNREKEEMSNVVNVYTYGDYEKVVRILLTKTLSTKTTEAIPKEVIYEGTKELVLDKSESDKDYYYVYYMGELQSIYTSASNAVKEANDNYGTVLNSGGYYVWYRANRDLRNQIMDLSVDADPTATENSVAYCLDLILNYEGIVRNTEYLLERGETVIGILEEALEDARVLDLTGCSLDSILYYVNRDIPVLALTNTGEACLVIGFNQLAVVLYDPVNGWYKMGLNEADEMFSESGNQFITYVYTKS